MSGHLSPKSTYYAIFGALMVFTAITVGVAIGRADDGEVVDGQARVGARVVHVAPADVQRLAGSPHRSRSGSFGGHAIELLQRFFDREHIGVLEHHVVEVGKVR